MSFKNKKSRHKIRLTPYARPILPTPSSPSEAEYEPVIRESTGFSEKFTSPVELSSGTSLRETFVFEEDARHRESTGFSLGDGMLGQQESPIFSTNENLVAERENTGFSTNENILPLHQSTEFSVAEEIMPTELNEKEDSPQSKSMDYFSNSEHIECFTPMKMTPRPETPQQAPQEEPQDIQKDEQQDIPLKYGDLVVVDYAEKKKVHKWPAIVVHST
jgi:hypothetical protein